MSVITLLPPHIIYLYYIICWFWGPRCIHLHFNTLNIVWTFCDLVFLKLFIISSISYFCPYLCGISNELNMTWDNGGDVFYIYNTLMRGPCPCKLYNINASFINICFAALDHSKADEQFSLQVFLQSMSNMENLFHIDIDSHQNCRSFYMQPYHHLD